MTILVYSSQQNKAGNDIQTAIASSLKDHSQLRMVGSITELRLWLLQPRIAEKSCIVVLIPGHLSELEEMINLQSILRKQRLVIVLPEHNAEIVTKAHRLHPRFLSFTDSECSAITDVLSKMQKNIQITFGQDRKKINQAVACI